METYQETLKLIYSSANGIFLMVSNASEPIKVSTPPPPKKKKANQSILDPPLEIVNITQWCVQVSTRCHEDAQASNTPRPMSYKNQIADSFHAFSVCIMDYFYNQVSVKGRHN